MAEYDEYLYQLGIDFPHPEDGPTPLFDHRTAMINGFDHGVRYERARITEILSVCGALFEVLYVNDVRPARVSLYKWSSLSFFDQARVLREESREVMGQLSWYLDQDHA